MDGASRSWTFVECMKPLDLLRSLQDKCPDDVGYLALRLQEQPVDGGTRLRLYGFVQVHHGLRSAGIKTLISDTAAFGVARGKPSVHVQYLSDLPHCPTRLQLIGPGTEPLRFDKSKRRKVEGEQPQMASQWFVTSPHFTASFQLPYPTTVEDLQVYFTLGDVKFKPNCYKQKNKFA